MQDSAHPVNDVNLQRNLMTTFIQIAAVVILISYCLDIVGPFVSLIIWGLVLAVAIHPLFLKLAAALGGKEKLAATLIIVIGLAIVVSPRSPRKSEQAAWRSHRQTIRSRIGR